MAIYQPIEADGPRRRLELLSPIDLESIGTIECATAEDVQAAIERARKAQPAWAELSFEERGRFVYRFIDRLKDVAAGNDRPIALICAEGVRSATMQKSLMEFGFKGVIDVHDGMAGNRAGSGWIKSGLPVTPYNPKEVLLNR